MSTEISDMIGRDDVNDLEAILAITNTDVDEVDPRGQGQRRRASSRGTTRSGSSRAAASSTRRRRRRSGTARPTSTGRSRSTRRRSSRAPTAAQNGSASTPTRPHRHAVRELGRQGVARARHRVAELDAEQFMHGEQGALLCTAKIVETVPWIDAKYYAVDAGDGRGPPRRGVRQVPRHEAVGPLPDQRPPAACCSTTSSHDSRWDMTYLGMQIMVEGLALAAFGFMHQMTTEPLLKQLLRYVMSDEARHVAFGVLSLAGVLRRAHRRRDPRAPGVRLRGRGAHARPLPAAGGVGAHGRRRRRRSIALVHQAPTTAAAVPADAVLEDRAELQEARPARRGRRLAARALRASSA